MSLEALPADLDAVLFDLDGTLCDSAAGIVQHLTMALEATGFPVPSREVMLSCVGPPWTDGFPPAVGVPVERTWDVIDAYRSTYDEAAPSLAIPFPGVVEAVGRLAEAGLTLAIASSKPQHLVEAIVGSGPMAAWFPVLVGADPASGRHTKADSVVVALERSGAAGEHTVMVGDRHHDVEGAAFHGLATIGVDWGAAEPGELETAGAVLIVSSPAELADVLLARVPAS